MRGFVALLLVASSLAVLFAVPTGSAAAPLLPERDASSGGFQSPPAPGPLDPPFAANVQVSESDTPGNQNEISVAVESGGRIHMGWNDDRLPNPDYRCGYAYSTDGGLTWSANRLFIETGWDAAGDPVVVVDSNDDVYFICMSFSRAPGGSSRIVVYKSTDGGVTWSSGSTASDTTAGLNDKPWGYAIGTTLFVCYANFGAAPNELRVTRSFDGGLTWEPTQVVDRGGNGCGYAHTSPTNVIVGWLRSGAIYAYRSTDGGATWSAATVVGGAPFTPAGDQRAGALPSFAADPARGRLYAVWPANDGLGTWDVRSSRSTDAGVTWSPFVIVNDVRTDRQFMAWADVGADGTVHAAWYDQRSGQMAVRYSNSTDLGATWMPSLRVTDTEWATAYFIGDYIALDVAPSGTVNVGWCDRRTGENEAFFARIPVLGSPRLDRIDVAPPEAWTDADSPVGFLATGYDQYGLTYPIAPTWAATGGSIAAGLYTPLRTGDWRVWANQSGFSGNAIVHVAPGTLARIDVSPPDVTITADGTQPYAATGYDAKDNVVPVAPAWGASDGTISGGGLFTPRRTGVWLVYANESGVTGSTSVQVVPGALAAIVVDPPTATITADETQQFTATGYDAKGNPRTVAPTWWTDGGSVSGTGLYTPQPVGAYTVWASDSGLTGSASVTVVPGALARIDVTPADLTITADQTVAYAAAGYDAKGNPVAIAPTWSATAGSIDGAGLYTPGPVGTHTVTATSGTVSGTTSVSVIAGGLARIDVVPPTATITADDVLQLTANGYDVRGNRVAIAPTWAATCGAVDGTGRYTPGPARLCLVYANESGLSGMSAVTVLPGQLARIDVDPPTATITADETQQFTARGYDAKGNPVAISPQWSVPEGTVSAAGLYLPRRTGVWTVTAAVAPVAGTASVTVTPGVLVAILVTPETATITADETQQFTATGYDARGNQVPLSSPVWTSEDGTIAAGLFEPRRTGTWEVAAAEGGVRGTARVTVRPGAVTTVTIQPDTGRVPEGGSLTFQAEAFDGKGNSVPDATFTWHVEGGMGSVDGAGWFRGTSGGEGRVVVTASDGQATATAGASVAVDGSFAVYLVLLLAVLVPLLLLLLWRRRKRRASSPRE